MTTAHLPPFPPLRGVLVAGAVIADTVVRPVDNDRWGATVFVDSVQRCVGGNAANTSLALARLGVPVRVAGATGQDDDAAFLRHALAAAGVDTTGLAALPQPTARTFVLVDSTGNRKFLHQMGAGAEAFSSGLDFPALQGAASHFHLASLFIVPHLRRLGPALLREARERGMTTSFDTNWDPLGRWMEDVGPLLPHLDLLFMNEDEARMVTGFEDPARAAEIVLARGVKVAVMKLSSRGCAIYSSGASFHAPAFPVTPIDSTGAGDSFVAGFLAALHHAPNLALPNAARFANAVGALNVQSLGATTGLRSYPDTLAWLAAQPGPSAPPAPTP